MTITTADGRTLSTWTDPVSGSTVVDALAWLPPDLLDQPVLDHGYVKLLDVMPRLLPVEAAGLDGALADAARVSYQGGTRSLRQDAALVDYLIRHEHTSPVEMAELKFQLRLPIFVMRQHVRHRTASLNEESARYSILTGEFHVPEGFRVNTGANRQAGSTVDLGEDRRVRLVEAIRRHDARSYGLYQALLGQDPPAEATLAADLGPLDAQELAAVAEASPGVAREQARMVLGTNVYTSCVWKIDLKNLLHYLRLRLAAEAQAEIRVYAQAMARVVAVLFPAAWESFRTHFIDGLTLSPAELAAYRVWVTDRSRFPDHCRQQGWSTRRIDELAGRFQNLEPCPT